MKKIFSVAAVVITLIFVVYMVKVNEEIEINKVVMKDQSTEQLNKDKNVIKETTKPKEEVVKNKDSNKDIKKDKKIEKKPAKDKKENTVIQNSPKQDESIKKAEDTEKSEEKTAAVFKVDKNTIVSRVSLEDKAKLLIYSRNLSTADEAQIKELMKSSDELNSSIKIFRILKLRLDPKDYNSVKSILSPYIDINLIEKNLK